jgi:hypothetical protein
MVGEHVTDSGFASLQGIEIEPAGHEPEPLDGPVFLVSMPEGWQNGNATFATTFANSGSAIAAGSGDTSANIAVAAAKYFYGVFSGSISMQADGFHSLFDGTSNVIGLIGLAVAIRPPDRGPLKPDRSPRGRRSG